MVLLQETWVTEWVWFNTVLIRISVISLPAWCERKVETIQVLAIYHFTSSDCKPHCKLTCLSESVFFNASLISISVAARHGRKVLSDADLWQLPLLRNQRARDLTRWNIQDETVIRTHQVIGLWTAHRPQICTAKRGTLDHRATFLIMKQIVLSPLFSYLMRWFFVCS